MAIDEIAAVETRHLWYDSLQLGLMAALDQTGQQATFTSALWRNHRTIHWTMGETALACVIFDIVNDGFNTVKPSSLRVSLALKEMVDQHPCGEFVHFSAGVSGVEKLSWAVGTLTHRTWVHTEFVARYHIILHLQSLSRLGEVDSGSDGL
jgi:hypothetical protein